VKFWCLHPHTGGNTHKGTADCEHVSER